MSVFQFTMSLAAHYQQQHSLHSNYRGKCNTVIHSSEYWRNICSVDYCSVYCVRQCRSVYCARQCLFWMRQFSGLDFFPALVYSFRYHSCLSAIRFRNEPTCTEKKSNPWIASSRKDTVQCGKRAHHHHHHHHCRRSFRKQEDHGTDLLHLLHILLLYVLACRLQSPWLLP